MYLNYQTFKTKKSIMSQVEHQKTTVNIPFTIKCCRSLILFITVLKVYTILTFLCYNTILYFKFIRQIRNKKMFHWWVNIDLKFDYHIIQYTNVLSNTTLTNKIMFHFQ